VKSSDVARIAFKIETARRRDKWTAEKLAAWRAKKLIAAARWARKHSPYYASVLQNWDGETFAALPVLTKQEYLARWNDIVTNERLTKGSVDAFLATSPSSEELLFGRYHVQATSGTSGVMGTFAHSTDEWINVCAGVGRIPAWRGPAFEERPKRYAIVSLDEGFHMGSRIAASSKRFFEHVLQVGAGWSAAAQAAALNDFQPDAISAYPTALAALAEEQAAGRLSIRPKQIVCSSEMLSPALAMRIAAVFGIAPHNTYSATEFGVGAATCAANDGMHLLEDMAHFESVDEEHRPVPAGTAGAKTLVTVFWARTLPLIRYELADRIVMDDAPCVCGLPYARIARIEGRSTDILRFRTRAGAEAAMSARQVEAMVADLPIVKWQIVRRTNGATLRLQRRGDGAPGSLLIGVRERLRLYDIGEESLTLDICDEIAPARSGKTPLFIDGSHEPQNGTARS
jgi:phenylacetate-coenzyme A ligase PaaK-like adenylate-forming protein